MPAPLFLNAVAMGTMHAEHKFKAGPITAPFRMPFKPVPENFSLKSVGNRKASVIPAIRNANTIPSQTRFK